MAIQDVTLKVGGGGSYTSMVAFNADASSFGTSGDLTATGDIVALECFGGADVGGRVTFSGWTTDAGDYIHIYAADGAEAQVPWTTSGPYYLEENPSTETGVFDPGSNFMLVEHIAFLSDGSGSNRTMFSYTGAANTTFNGCYCRADHNADFYRFTRSGSFYNCVFEAVNSNQSATLMQPSPSDAIVNCTFYSANTGASQITLYSRYYGTPAVNNCVAYSLTSDTTDCFYHADLIGDYNAGPLTESPGANSVDNISDPFVSATDFHLDNVGELEGAGDDLTGNGFEADFDKVTRPNGSAWDIGAFQYVADATPRPRPSIHSRAVMRASFY